MNQITKTTLAVFAVLVYALFCISAVDGHDSSRPHTHSEMIVVQTGAFNNIVGATNDPMTNVNLQTVLDAMDNSTLPTASNIVINTNNFGYFAPTNNTLQVLLDWQDDHAYTNIDNTNIYMTSVQSSNAFLSTGTTAFIRSDGGRVSNAHMAVNAILSSNISPNTIVLADIETNQMKMLRASGYTQTFASDATCSACTASGFTLVGTTQVSRVTDVKFYMFFDPDTIIASGINKVRAMYTQMWVSSNGTTWAQVQSSLAKSTYATGVLAFLNDNAPAQVSYTVPQGHYYWINGIPGHTNSIGIDLVMDWAMSVNESAGP